MIRRSAFSFIAFLLFFSLHAQGASGGLVAKHITALQSLGVAFEPVALFTPVPESPATDALWSRACYKAAVLRFDPARAAKVLGRQPQYISFSVPGPDGHVVMDMEKVDITTSDFRVVQASTNLPVRTGEAVHYQGMVRGEPGSIAAISIFPDQVMGVLGDSDGERVIGRFDNDREGLHVFYREQDLRSRRGSECAVREVPGGASHAAPAQAGERSIRCVRFYWEADHDIFLNKGSVTNATNYVTGLFNQSSILYANDGIDVALSEVFVWDVTSPYTSNDPGDLLDLFGVYRTSFNGDLAHLLALRGGGGIAWLNTLCSSQTKYRMAFSGINTSYSSVPTYSWSVEVVTHEQGHNLGSPHTHDCAWNGNGTAIDGCGPIAGYSVPGCPVAPLPTDGGAIMSYCHMVGGVGINFNNGFGPQPAALIRNHVNAATCLDQCGSTCDPPSWLGVDAVTANSAMLTWLSTGAITYTLQWRVSPAGTWNIITGLTGNGYMLNNLSEGISYDFRVYSSCDLGDSDYSEIITFITGNDGGDDNVDSNCNCWISPDNTYTLALQPNNDNSSVAINLPFGFNLYGDYYSTCFVNNNGNISFVDSAGISSSMEFPNNQFKMVAPFWADVDTRGDDGNGLNGGTVMFKLTPNGLYVNWTSVGYSNSETDKHNSFQLIISDGANTDIGIGNTVSFCYKDMQWTTGTATQGVNGFGGTPATVGANSGNGVNYIQFGRFDHEGTEYDGPFGGNDGVSWLDNKNFVFTTVGSSQNLPPIASSASLCDTMDICVNELVNLKVDYLAPEPGQLTTASYTLVPPLNAVITEINTSPANTTNLNLLFIPLVSDTGYHVITYTATDDGVPALTSTTSVVLKVQICASPPGNDNCVDALPVTVNPNYSCNMVTSGTLNGATNSGMSISCYGTPDNDVWFTFTATDTLHRISLNENMVSTTDIYMALWVGGCNDLNLIPNSCSDMETMDVGGLIAGTTYYLQVYSASSGAEDIVFDVCVGTNVITIVGEQSTLTNYSVFPNPANTELFIHTPMGKPVHFKVYDLIGQVVLENYSATHLFIKNLAPGGYSLVILDREGVVKSCIRFVKL